MVVIEADIRFPNLGIELEHVGKSFQLFGIEIAYYGVIIALGMIAGYLLVEWKAKKTGQNSELYADFALYAIILSVVGARVFYVIFAWDEFKDNLIQVFNTRGGGLAIYGGVIAAGVTAMVYSKIKKVSFWVLVDTGCLGLVTGQIIGRWGNFFNREAFGGFSNNFLAMQLKKSQVASINISKELYEKVVLVDSVEYIQVHPTFLYESLWNVMVLIILLTYFKYKKFDGEIFMLYLLGYGTGRLWIEGLRTDQLLVWGTRIPVSQFIAFSCMVVSMGVLIFNYRKINKKHDV